MGGLEVDSNGQVHETILGLEVYQTRPLDVKSITESLDALHNTGIEVDSSLRPNTNYPEKYNNIFVTGRTLAHWNPSEEGSSDGVCIATGWAAAENAHQYLVAKNAA